MMPAGTPFHLLDCFAMFILPRPVLCGPPIKYRLEMGDGFFGGGRSIRCSCGCDRWFFFFFLRRASLPKNRRCGKNVSRLKNEISIEGT